MVEDPARQMHLLNVLVGLVGQWVSPAALMVLHHAPMHLELDPNCPLLEKDSRVYGRSQLTFLRPADVEGK
jgi:hypothetical protein